MQLQGRIWWLDDQPSQGMWRTLLRKPSKPIWCLCKTKWELQLLLTRRQTQMYLETASKNRHCPMLTNAPERSWTSTTELTTAKQFISLHCCALAFCSDSVYTCCQRPYRVKSTRSHLNSEDKLHKARLMLGWGTAWQALRVLLTFWTKGNFQISRALLASMNDERPDSMNIEC